MSVTCTNRKGRGTALVALACITLTIFLTGCWKLADADDFPGKYTSNSELGSSIELRSDGTFTEWRDGKASEGSWSIAEDDDCPNIYFRRLSGANGGLFDPERTTCLQRGYGEYRIVIDPDLDRYYTRQR